MPVVTPKVGAPQAPEEFHSREVAGLRLQFGGIVSITGDQEVRGPRSGKSGDDVLQALYQFEATDEQEIGPVGWRPFVGLSALQGVLGKEVGQHLHVPGETEFLVL